MTRWVVRARAAFSARHALLAYRGRPEAAHEHRWQVEVQVGTDSLHEEGYALDFHAVRGALEEAVAGLDGSDLNRHPVIGTPTPSAERVAQYLADRLGPPIDGLGGRLLVVSVWEGPDNRVDLHLA